MILGVLFMCKCTTFLFKTQHRMQTLKAEREMKKIN